jgi:hypothetical protein
MFKAIVKDKVQEEVLILSIMYTFKFIDWF